MDEEPPFTKIRRSSYVNEFTPALIINPNATDSQNEQNNLERYFAVFSRGNIDIVYVIILDFLQNSKESVDRIKKTLNAVLENVISLEVRIKLGSDLFLNDVFFNESPHEVYNKFKKMYNERKAGYKSSVQRWVKKKFDELDGACTTEELKECALRESTMYFLLHKMGIPCTLHAGELDSFLHCLERAPHILNRKMRYYELEKFSELFCGPSYSVNRAKQCVMVAYARGVPAYFQREDGYLIEINYLPQNDPKERPQYLFGPAFNLRKK